MNQNATTPDYDADHAALRATSLGDMLTRAIVDACREHEAAGRPPVELPSPAESLRQHRLRVALAPVFITAAAVFDDLPDQAQALAEAAERGGVDGVRAFMTTLSSDLAGKLSAALAIDVTGRLHAAMGIPAGEGANG